MAAGCVETKEVCAAAPICVTVEVAIFAVAAVMEDVGKAGVRTPVGMAAVADIIGTDAGGPMGLGRVGDKPRTAGFGLAID